MVAYREMPFRLPLREKGRYIFPNPYMAIVTAPGCTATEVRIPAHPPPERGNLVLQIALDRPRFEEVKEDIWLAKKHYNDEPRRIFLVGGRSLPLQTDKLLDVVNLCFKVFSNLERVSIYRDAKLILERDVDDLKLLRQAGLFKIYTRLETGDEELLRSIKTGITTPEMVRVAEMAKEAGIELSVTVRLGIGGAGSWKRNAELTAQVLNRTQPPEIRLHHLIIHPGSPLREKVARGEYKEASRYEILKEMRELIAHLNYKTKVHTHRIMIRGLPIERHIPEEQERILGILDFALHYFFAEDVDPERIRGYSMADILEWDGYEDTHFSRYEA